MILRTIVGEEMYFDIYYATDLMALFTLRSYYDPFSICINICSTAGRICLLWYAAGEARVVIDANPEESLSYNFPPSSLKCRNLTIL